MTNLEQSRKESGSRIFLDCSRTYRIAAQNGVQRVVRNLAKESRTVAEELAATCQPVARIGNQFYRAPFALQQAAWHEPFWMWLKRPYTACMTATLRHLPSRSLKRLLLPNPGRRGIFHVPYLIAQKLGEWTNIAASKFGVIDDPQITFRAGDTLVIMEPCTYKDNWEPLDRLRSQGVHIGLLTYDLIPILHPELCDKLFVEQFKPWLEGTAERSDFFISISNTVSHSLANYLHRVERVGQRSAAQFTSFRLGAQLDRVETKDNIRSELATLFQPQASPAYLLVAMLEPRKNHKFLLDAFEIAWRNSSPARLVLAGRIGWMCDDTINRIRNHPEFGKRLFWFHDLSDTELEFCYQQAKGLVYPSIVEGFGLPLIEALRHRLLVLASDIPVHREVGQDFCAYFDLKHPEQLAEMIGMLDRDPRAIPVRDPAEYDVVDWRHSCREFLSAIIAQTRRLSGLERQCLADAPTRRAA